MGHGVGLSDKIGMNDGCYIAANTNFLHGDVAQISKFTLSTTMKDNSKTLTFVKFRRK